MDENQIEAIAVNMLAPQVGRLLALCGASLATVGVTVNIGEGSSVQIATVLVGLALVIFHEVQARLSQKATARTAFVQGAAAAGMTVTKEEIPEVVNGNKPIISVIPSPK